MTETLTPPDICVKVIDYTMEHPEAGVDARILALCTFFLVDSWHCANPASEQCAAFRARLTEAEKRANEILQKKKLQDKINAGRAL